MFGKIFTPPQKKRAEKVFQQLTSIAVRPVSEPSFEQSNALYRAYMVALGITVPQHVVMAAFPDKIYPKWDDTVWRRDLTVFLDLAAVLAWRQCLSAFSDLQDVLEPDAMEGGRRTLMEVAGTVFPASDRADALMRRYHKFETDAEARRAMWVDTPFEHEPLFTSMKHLEIHAWMVNETLGEPSLFQSDPVEILALNMYLANVEIEATKYFKARALDLLSKHIAAGRP